MKRNRLRVLAFQRGSMYLWTSSNKQGQEGFTSKDDGVTVTGQRVQRGPRTIT